MRRKLAAVLAIAITSVGVTVLAAAPASAAASIRCGTASYSVPEIDIEAGGQIIIVGYHQASYVGEYVASPGTYRFWHYTYQSNSSGLISYRGAAAVRCNSASEEMSDVDLNREVLAPNSSSLCGTTDFNSGSNHYTYLSTRSTEGDQFRYWGGYVKGRDGVFRRTPAAARCD
ncbi:hypothetical protein Rhe02_16020 [Rhizocola hellebori]|uniref:Secreted protein n=1 Tax=Rhizocola hellebori TaxID=1392758 RepID=A0A8J3VEH2_9ACTN|nr:hypothetical protein [Rhizocola hellebori]GIH03535.1 hypothetical protein Rhe02_16020 [Rhizocola hellebori]